MATKYNNILLHLDGVRRLWHIRRPVNMLGDEKMYLKGGNYPPVPPRNEQKILNKSDLVCCWGQQFIHRLLKIKGPYFLPCRYVFPNSLLLGVIQRSNKRIVGEKQAFLGHEFQSVLLLNFFVAEHIFHYSPNLCRHVESPL